MSSQELCNGVYYTLNYWDAISIIKIASLVVKDYESIGTYNILLQDAENNKYSILISELSKDYII